MLRKMVTRRARTVKAVYFHVSSYIVTIMLTKIAIVSMGQINPIKEVTIFVSLFTYLTSTTITATIAVIIEKIGPNVGNLVFATHCVKSLFGRLPSISHFFLQTPASRSQPLEHE